MILNNRNKAKVFRIKLRFMDAGDLYFLMYSITLIGRKIEFFLYFSRTFEHFIIYSKLADFFWFDFLLRRRLYKYSWINLEGEWEGIYQLWDLGPSPSSSELNSLNIKFSWAISQGGCILILLCLVCILFCFNYFLCYLFIYLFICFSIVLSSCTFLNFCCLLQWLLRDRENTP